MRPDTPIDPEPRQVDVLGSPLAYTETGTGRNVVAVHGLPASSRDFRWLDAALDRRVRFFRPDLPGFGGTAVSSSGEASFSSMADAVCAFCEALDLDEVVLVGHSMGGAVAVEAALGSERVRGAVLVNSSGPRMHRGNLWRSYRVALALMDFHPWSRAVSLAVTRPIARAMGFSKRLPDDELVLAARMASRYDPTRMGEQLRELDKPLMVVWATADPAVEVAVSDAILEAAPHAIPLQIEARTHNLQSTHATELADAIVAFACGGDPAGP
jgi:pimeloyl-ACP methyl ester carboxylesterase